MSLIFIREINKYSKWWKCFFIEGVGNINKSTCNRIKGVKHKISTGKAIFQKTEWFKPVRVYTTHVSFLVAKEEEWI